MQILHKPPIFSHIFKVNSRRLNAEKELQEKKILAFFKEIKMKNELQAASHGFRVAVSQNKDESRFGFQTRILFEDVGIMATKIRQQICRKEGFKEGACSLFFLS